MPALGSRESFSCPREMAIPLLNIRRIEVLWVLYRHAESRTRRLESCFRIYPDHGRFWLPRLRHHRACSAEPDHSIRRRQHGPRRLCNRLFRICLGCHAIYFFAAARRLVRPFRPASRHPLLLRPRRRLHFHGPRANAAMAVRRPAHFRNSLTLLRSHPDLGGFAVVMALFYVAQQSLLSVFVLYTEYRYAWSRDQVGLASVITFAASANVEAYFQA
jgi:hypothetical protein